MTRDDARAYFKYKGLTYGDIKLNHLRYLKVLLDEQFIKFQKDVIAGNRYPYWVRTNDAKYFKGRYTQDGKLINAYITGKGTYFSAREVISFNADGYIGFCGDASGANAEPVVAAFCEWCDWLQRQIKPAEEE